jgi:hypothetical protein
MSDGIVDSTSVNGGACRLLEPFDLILEKKFPAFQFDDLHVVGGQMKQSLVQFVFQGAVFPFQFNEMRLNRHIEVSSVSGPQTSIRTIEFTPHGSSVDVDRRLPVEFLVLSEMNLATA